MAKTQTYSEDLLLDAVIKYADKFNGKIQLADLAKWAGINIPGLEGVRYYHFSRPQKITDPKTGKKIEKKKVCTERIEEINKARSAVYSIKKNILLQSAQIDEFFRLPIQSQRKMVIDTREQMDLLLQKNIYLERMNKKLNNENKNLQEKNSACERRQNELMEKQKLVSEQVDALIKRHGEKTIKEALGNIGITKDGYSLKTYVDSLAQDIGDVFSVNKAIHKEIEKTDSKVTDDILKGLDF